MGQGAVARPRLLPMFTQRKTAWMPVWLLLTYKLPTEPSRRRVYVWRKLKRLGAIRIFEAVWGPGPATTASASTRQGREEVRT